ncbi:MAG: sigma-70 family RNA polymerase sigma factor [Alistipes sp.]|nr:sigma-70 family RNA polymerase sigma factor [Alistipes sp.]
MVNFGPKYFEYTEAETKELFTRLYPRLCQYINGIIRGGELADDIIQEVFYKFLRRRPFLSRDKVVPYLFSMAHNECYDYLRRNKIAHNRISIEAMEENKVWENLAMRDFLDSSNESPVATMMIEEVLSFCDTLPPQTAKIFRMSRIEDMTNKEIAAELGIAQRTVEKHISLSIKRFRDMPLFKKL